MGIQRSTRSGSATITRNRTSDALSGMRTPRSHCLNVESGKPKRIAKSACENFTEIRELRAAAIAGSIF